MWIFNGFRSIFTTAKHRNVVHRSRTVEGDQRDNVTKVCWLYLSQRLAHSFRFQLEHADRVAPFQKVVYRPIEIGRASCRERVGQYLSISVVAVSLKKKNILSKYNS